jgi:hypothetical protein
MFLGSSKTPYKYFCKKSMSKTFAEKINQNFDVRFSSTFFVLSRSRVFLSDESSKTPQDHKKHFAKTSCRKFFTKKSTKKSKTEFFSIYFNHIFGRFSVREVQSRDKKMLGKSDQPWCFCGPRGTNQPHGP